MIENELNARLQHAVEHTETNNNVATQYPANNSVPLKGEIVFNSTLTDFKVGDGENQYSVLSNFLPTTFSGASTLADGTKGLVPAPAQKASGEADKFLCDDGSWKIVSSSGGTDTHYHTELNGNGYGDTSGVDLGSWYAPESAGDANNKWLYWNNTSGHIKPEWNTLEAIIGEKTANYVLAGKGAGNNVDWKQLSINDLADMPNTANGFLKKTTTGSTVSWSLESINDYSVNGSNVATHGLVPAASTAQITSGDYYLNANGSWSSVNSIVNNTSVKLVGAQTSSSVFAEFTLNQVADPNLGYIELTIPTFKQNGKNYGFVPLYSDNNPNLVLKSDGTWGSFSYSLDTSFYGSLPVGWSENGTISGTTEHPLVSSKLNLISGSNITFTEIKNNNNEVAGIKINATGSGGSGVTSITAGTGLSGGTITSTGTISLNIATTTGTQGGLLIENNTESSVIYANTEEDYISVPIYYTDSAAYNDGTDIGERHFVNIYDIAKAIGMNTDLRDAFNAALKGEYPQK